jgi:hypothetical protein
MSKQLEAWEGEGGAALALLPDPVQLTGTASQVEWAERVRRQVYIEFDRVAESFRAVAQKQPAGKRADTEAIIAILEDKRAEVMSREQAGYFIRDWQEIDGQVRQLIAADPRYLETKSHRLVHATESEPEA